MNREELIEKAAAAIYNDDPAWGYVYEDDRGEYAAPWEHLGEDLWEKFRGMAERALVIFGKANNATAPTEDERECGFMGCGASQCASVCTPEVPTDGEPHSREGGQHDCESCPTCGWHDGRQAKCCGCYDGVCCHENGDAA